MADSVLRLAGKARSGLTVAGMSRGALSWIVRAAAPIGLLAGAARLSGLARSGLPLFAVFVGLFAAMGAFIAFMKRPGIAKAAFFVDGQLGDRELMSAALFCGQRGMTGPFDGRIAEAAEERAARELGGGGTEFDYGGKIVLKRGIAALVSLIAGFLLAFSPSLIESIRGDGYSRDSLRGEARAEEPQSGRPVPAPRETARSVFPDDPRLARAAEKALASGNMDEFRKLVERADADLARRIAKSSSALERDRLEKQRRALQDEAKKAAERPAEDTRPGGGEKGESGPGERKEGQARGDSPGEEQVSDDEGKGPGTANEPGTEGEGEGEAAQGGGIAPGQGNDDDPFAERNQRGDGEGVGRPAGGMAGNEAGRGRGEYRDFERPDSGDRKTGSVKLSGREPDPLELILSGDERRAGPYSAAEAVKSAEAAMARDRVPAEYGDYVRAYYLSITSAEEGANDE